MTIVYDKVMALHLEPQSRSTTPEGSRSAARGQHGGPPDIVVKVAVAAVDDRVAGGQLRGKCDDSRFGRFARR